jgi:hypothetical protein
MLLFNNENFERNKEHYSNLYYGVSLPSLAMLGNKKAYVLVACNNVFFVKKNLLNYKVKELDVKETFKKRKFRKSRDENNKLSFLNSAEEKKLISYLL